jgi:hypothetical protein
VTEGLRYGDLMNATITSRTKDAALFRHVMAWAEATTHGQVETDGPLAGLTWDQRAWYTIRADGSRTCCTAGAVTLLAGAVPVDPVNRLMMMAGDTAPAIMFAGCRMPGTTWAVTPALPAGAALGLEPDEHGIIFAPFRPLDALTALIPVFERNGRIGFDSPEVAAHMRAALMTEPVGQPLYDPSGYQSPAGCSW